MEKWVIAVLVLLAACGGPPPVTTHPLGPGQFIVEVHGERGVDAGQSLAELHRAAGTACQSRYLLDNVMPTNDQSFVSRPHQIGAYKFTTTRQVDRPGFVATVRCLSAQPAAVASP